MSEANKNDTIFLLMLTFLSLVGLVYGAYSSKGFWMFDIFGFFKIWFFLTLPLFAYLLCKRLKITN